MGGEAVSIGLVFLAGVLSFASPCVLPIVPAYLSVISGLSFEEMQAGSALARRRLAAGALAFVLGFSVVLIGVLGGLTLALSRLGPGWRSGIAVGMGLVVAVFALHLIGVFRINALFAERRFHVDVRRWGLLGAFLVGAAFAFGWSPCIGPILGSVMAISATSARLGLLVVYAAGLALPFLLAALFVGLFLRVMPRLTRHLRAIEVASGVLLLVMAVVLMTGNMHWLTAKLGFLGAWSAGAEQGLVR